MHLVIRFVEIAFLIGVAGCLVTIPSAAWAYCSVLFEKDQEEQPPETAAADD